MKNVFAAGLLGLSLAWVVPTDAAFAEDLQAPANQATELPKCSPYPECVLIVSNPVPGQGGGTIGALKPGVPVDTIQNVIRLDSLKTEQLNINRSIGIQ